jgi:hypothetical protein
MATIEMAPSVYIRMTLPYNLKVYRYVFVKMKVSNFCPSGGRSFRNSGERVSTRKHYRALFVTHITTDVALVNHDCHQTLRFIQRSFYTG